MTERDETPLWTIDEQRTELELRESASGPHFYTVRFKAHTETRPYDPKKTIYPLQHNGTQTESTGKASILVPDVTVTVGLFDHPVLAGAIGAVRGSEWQGMCHHEIAKARGLYFAEDRAFALWEVDSFGRLDDITHGRLWQSFESWLVTRFPDATRIFTDDDEPGDSRTENQEFLRSLGYQQVGARIFSREVVRPCRISIDSRRRPHPCSMPERTTLHWYQATSWHRRRSISTSPIPFPAAPS